jgi:hypothetical protein
MTELVMEKENLTIVLSEEELATVQMALMRGMKSSNPYFRESCEKLLQKMLRGMSRD